MLVIVGNTHIKRGEGAERRRGGGEEGGTRKRLESSPGFEGEAVWKRRMRGTREGGGGGRYGMLLVVMVDEGLTV